MRRAVILLLIAFLITFPILAAEPADLASQAIPVLAALEAGVADTEVKTATLGSGIKLQIVGLRDLRAFTGPDVTKVLIDAKTTYFPVYVGKELRSEITVATTPRGVEVVEYGRTSLVRQYEKIRGNRTATFLLHIPALKSFFVAQPVEGGLTLYPMHNVRQFKMGQGVPAAEVLGELAKIAKTMNDDDPA